MELKKSRKYDLEHTRNRRLSLALMSVVAGGLLIAFSPIIIGTVMKIQQQFDDDTIEDLNIDYNEEDKMIAAVQTEVQEEVTEIVKPVESLTEEVPPEEAVMVEPQEEKITEKELLPEESETAEPLTSQEEVDANPLNRLDKFDEALSEQLPEYPGGMSELVTWLTKNIVYPPAARRQGIEGEVQVSFIIEKDGSLTDIKIHKPAAHVFNEEALRVVKKMPNWKPGKLDGKVCRTLFVIPIQFNL